MLFRSAALVRCQRALELDTNAQGAESPDVALDLACLGEAHLGLGTAAQAVTLLERARDIHARAPGDKLDVARASFLLGQALWRHDPSGARGRASRLLEEARLGLESLGTRARVELREVTEWRTRHAQDLLD